MNYIHQRIKKWWHSMLLGFITIYRILSVGFRMNFSLIILLFQASSAQADTILRSKGQAEVYILIYLIPWSLGFTYYSLGCFLVLWGFFSFFYFLFLLSFSGRRGGLVGFFSCCCCWFFVCLFLFVGFCWFSVWFIFLFIFKVYFSSPGGKISLLS